MEAMEKKKYLEAMGRNTEKMTDEDLAAVDTAALAKEHAEKANKKRDEAERKVKEAAKKLDYIVRAIRIEELPLVKSKLEERVKGERQRYEADIINKAKKAKRQREQDVQDKGALEAHSIFGHLSPFEEKAMAGRRSAHAAACAEKTSAPNASLSRGRWIVPGNGR